MSERLTIILNSLVSAILVVVVAGAVYLFSRTEHLTREVSSINRQIGDLKEVASSTFEQTMRRFDDFSRQLSGIAPNAKNSNADKAVPAPAKTPVTISPARQPVRHPKDPRKEQETKLNRDRLQFLASQARQSAAKPTPPLCVARSGSSNSQPAATPPHKSGWASRRETSITSFKWRSSGSTGGQSRRYRGHE